MYRMAFVLALAGCQFDPRTAAVDGGVDPDGTPPSDGDAPPADTSGCFGTYMTICPATPPTAPLDLGNVTLDTTTSVLCEPTTGGTAAEACVISGTSITINGTLRATGTRPLILLATTGSITVVDTIDVSSRRGAGVGAGRGVGACNVGTAPTGDGGGQGGSYGGLGGNGGNGNGAGAGTRGDVVALGAGELRGGCDGANGAGGAPGTRGVGGGAVLLVAATSIVADGTINASGSGATGATGSDDGGGGGGSGGTIVFDAPSVSIAGAVFANGGGGGEGSGTNNDGRSGGEPTATTPGGGGAGGTTSGGDGGDGSSGGDGAGGNNSVDSGGGGGGGGGAGVIRSVTPPTITGSVSPAAS